MRAGGVVETGTERMNPIPLLQRYLAQFLAIVLPPEELRLGAAGTLGPATLDATEAFLARAGLAVPLRLRPRSSEWVDWLVGELEAALGARRSISGKVVGRDGEGIAGLRIAALERDLPSIERRRAPPELGRDITDEDGGFNILYAPDPEGETDEAAAADVSIAVTDGAGQAVAILALRLDDRPHEPDAILFNIPARCELRVTVDAARLGGRSEYERLLARIAPALRDLAPEELTAEDVAFLAQETPLSREDRQRVEWLRRAAALGRRSGLPAEAFYGWGRLGLPDRFEALADTPPEAQDDILAGILAEDVGRRQEVLEEAVAAAIIPPAIAGLSGALDRGLVQARPLRRIGTARLLDAEDGTPLPGLRVDFAPPGGAPHASVTADARGYLPVLVPPGGEADGAALSVTVRRAEEAAPVALRIALPMGEELAELRVPRPAPPAAPNIAALAATAGLDLPDGLAQALAGQGVRSLADITARGGLGGLDGLQVAAEHPALRLLESHADLSRASADAGANAAVIAAGFDGIAAIAAAPRAGFVAALGPTIGDLEAGELHAVAGAQSALLANATLALAAEQANGQADPAEAKPVLGPARCQCRDCETAVSPLSYLADLGAHVARRVSAGGAPATLAGLQAQFHQPLATLPAECGAVDRELRQVRICVEVLRAELGARPPAGAAAAALAEAEAAWRATAYETLLLRLGTSSAEIRLAATADGAARAALAERLQVPLAHLGELRLDPAAPESEAALEALSGLRDTRRPPLDPAVSPKLLEWRRSALREAWRRQDQPADRYAPRRVTAPLAALPAAVAGALPAPLSHDEAAQLLACEGELSRDAHAALAALSPDPAWQAALRGLRAASRCLPAVDPDLIGPDDLRAPHPGAPAFDLWLKRRLWVDARLAELAAMKVAGTELPGFPAMLARMAQPLDYDGTSLPPWPAAPVDLAALRASLSGPGAEEARFRLEQVLNLTEPALDRLLALKARLAAHRADPRAEAPDAAEALEFRSILVQAMKAAFNKAWRAEEAAAGLRLGPAGFWPALAEPRQGPWPPEPLPAPLLDPLRLDDDGLPGAVAGVPAAALLAQRRADVAAAEAELRQAAATGDFANLLRAALGHPKVGGAPQHDLDQLRAELGSPVPAVAEAALGRVNRDLGLGIEAFRRLLAIRAAAAGANPPTAADWKEAVALLLPARIAKHERPAWAEEEDAAKLRYWQALRAALPPWRAPAEARAAWQAALRARSAAPVLDPDLVMPGDLRKPAAGEAAYDLLAARGEALEAELAALQALPETVAGFDARLARVLGHGTDRLLAIAAARDAGRVLGPRLAQLPLGFEGFALLERVARLLAAGAAVTEEEWGAAHGVLLAAWKRLRAAEWLEEERANGVLLGPDAFQPPPDEDAGWRADPWRAPPAARQAFRDALRIRFEAEAGLGAALATAVDGVEEAVLPALRDALLAALPLPGAPADQAARIEAAAHWVGANLLIDARTAGCARTTRVAQAIETLQSLVLTLRAGQAGPALAGWTLDLTEHDREWPWMGSYAAWRSAVLVLLYPENLLHPSLLRDRSPGLVRLLQATRGTTGRDAACAAARDYVTYLQDVARLSVQVTCTARTALSEDGGCSAPRRDERCFFYLFGLGGASGRPYVARQDLQGGGQSWWTPIEVPGFDRLTSLIGAVPYRTSAGTRFIFLIGHREPAADQSGLVCVKYDLDAGGGLSSWFAEMPDLKMPDFDNRRFNAVVKQTDIETEPPHILVHLPTESGARYAEARMNAAGMGWEEGGLKPVVPKAFGTPERRAPAAMLALRGHDFALLLAGGGFVSAYLCFRIGAGTRPERFGTRVQNSGGRSGSFVGAFGWKGITGFFLLTSQALPSGSPFALPGLGSKDSFAFVEPSTDPLVLTASIDLASPFPAESPVVIQVGGLGGPSISRSLRPSWGINDDAVGKTARLVYHSPWRTEAHRPMLIRQDGLPRPSHFIPDGRALPVLPNHEGPDDLPIALTREQRQARQIVQQQGANSLSGHPPWLRAYLEEGWYAARVALGLALHRSRDHEAALDCFRTVFDDTAAPGRRKIHPGLVAEEALPHSFKRAEDWLRDPLDPHAIAATRRNTRTRFVRIAILRVQLDWADEAFGRDTPEARPVARRLYQDVLDGLDAPELRQAVAPDCEAIIGTLDDRLDPRWTGALAPVKAVLHRIGDPVALTAAVARVKAALGAAATPADGIAAALRAVQALPTAPPRDLAKVVQLDAARRGAARRALSAAAPVAAAVAGLREGVAAEFRRVAAVVAGAPQRDLVRGRADLGFLRQADVGTARPQRPALRMLQGMADGSVEDVLAPTRLAPFAAVFRQAPQAAASILSAVPQAVMPMPSLAFCIPPNPVLAALRARAEVNLRKLRSCRTISGLRRAADPYGAPTDAASGLPLLGAGGTLVLPGLRSLPPTLYRYAVLVERAKQMAQMASQMEGAMFAALERGDAARLAVLKARQDLELAGAGLQLQALRIEAAGQHVELARLGQARAELQRKHYGELLAKPVSDLENEALRLLDEAAEFLDSADDLQAIAAGVQFAQVAFGALAELVGGFLVGGPKGAALGLAKGVITNKDAFVGGLGSSAAALSSRAEIRSTRSSRVTMQASFERREQEWRHQLDLAGQDVLLAGQQLTISGAEKAVTEQEHAIAGIQQRHARDTLEFLTTRQFGTAQLHEWMAGVLQEVYGYFLRQATATARVAEAQLAFERQEPPAAILLSDYWRADGAAEPGGEAQPDRRGLTGSARLLRDIARLDQHAFETRRRKLQLTKTLSLARLAPLEFQRFRETGVMTFATPMELFDRDFPGHYLRLVSRVSVSVVALVPPVQGIRATLANSGVSRVVIGPDIFQTVPIRREPEQIALSAPMNATGLLDLEAQPDMLRPFEGCGVDGVWEFRMPRAANAFDFRTIADVLVTLDYTALDSPDHRAQVLSALPSSMRTELAFGFRSHFPDQWFDLNNPAQSATPMRVGFRLLPEDVPPNLDGPRIEHVALLAARRSRAELPIEALRLREAGAPGATGGPARTVDGLASTRTGSGAAWAGMIGRSPVGEWEMALPDTDDMRQRFAASELRDLFLVISIVGRLPSWPE